MRKILFLSLLFLCVLPASVVAQEVQNSPTYQTIGAEFTAVNPLTKNEMQQKYGNLKPGDTASVAFKAKVASVCQQKGCWMNLELSEADEVMVKFKDYAFFVPKNIGGKEVIVNGKAFVTELSVEEQRHYAEDAGKTSEEIEAITKPVKKLSFVADGVKIRN